MNSKQCLMTAQFCVNYSAKFFYYYYCSTLSLLSWHVTVKRVFFSDFHQWHKLTTRGSRVPAATETLSLKFIVSFFASPPGGSKVLDVLQRSQRTKSATDLDRAETLTNAFQHNQNVAAHSTSVDCLHDNQDTGRCVSPWRCSTGQYFD